eukprot:8601908-Prorocentrum_lima.AAC.1
MLSNALQVIYAKEEIALMLLSEVRTFNAIDIRSRHYDRETFCVNRAKSMDMINRDFKALVLSNNLPVMRVGAMDYILGFLT